MAVVAVAAIAGAGATTVVSAAVVGYIALAVTVVGVITKNETLTKIGAGLGLGGAAGGLMGLDQAASASAGQTAAAEAASANLGDAQVAGNVGAQTGSTTAPAGADLAASMDMGDAQVARAAPVASQPAPAAQALGSANSIVSPPQGATPLGTVGNTGSALTDAARQSTMSTGTDALAKVTGQAAQQNGENFFSKFWNGLDSSGKLAVGQTASGLISGVGSGASSYMSNEKQMKFQQDQLDYRRRNLNSQPILSYGSQVTQARTT